MTKPITQKKRGGVMWKNIKIEKPHGSMSCWVVIPGKYTYRGGRVGKDQVVLADCYILGGDHIFGKGLSDITKYIKYWQEAHIPVFEEQTISLGDKQ